MIKKSKKDNFVPPTETQRIYVQERTIIELTEAICDLMEREKVSRSEMAKRLGRSKSQISQMLAGGRNLTIRSVSDMLLVLGRSLESLTRDAQEESPGRYVRLDSSGWEYSGEQMLRSPASCKSSQKYEISTEAFPCPTAA